MTAASRSRNHLTLPVLLSCVLVAAAFSAAVSSAQDISASIRGTVTDESGGTVSVAEGSQKLAASLVTVPLGVALVIGFGAHFLSSGNDNVLHLPGELRLPFQVSAVLLVVFEAVGVFLGLQMFSIFWSFHQ